MTTLHERDFLTFVQVSDAHVGQPGQLSHDGVDNAAALQRAMTALVESGTPIDALLFSGDLVDDGDPRSYAHFMTIVQPAVEALGATVFAVPGNHDSRDGIRALLGGSAGDPEGEPVDTATEIGGVWVLGLDSSRPGREEGHLSEAQLEWLGHQLTRAGPGGAVVVVHHPPVTVPVGPGIDIALQDPEPLAEVLRGSTARLVLTGHSHFAGASVLGGVPVWIGGATCSNTVRLAPGMRTVQSTLVSRIDLSPSSSGGHFIASVPVGTEHTLREIGPERLRYRAPRIPDATRRLSQH